MELTVLLGGFAALLLIGVPVAFALGASALATVLYMDLPPVVVFQQLSSGMNVFSMLAIPFFIFAGDLMMRGGIADKLVALAAAMVGHLRGGLGQVNIVAATLFGGQPSTFGWLSSTDAIWKFDWNKLPLITAAVVGIVLAVIAFRAFSSAQRTRGIVATVCALLLFGWALFVGPNVKLLAAPELHGFNLALIGIVIAAVWQMSGYTMALYLAGLRGIPEELREAARVDGATEWQMYGRVIFPLLAPISLSAMIILGHISLKIFDLVYAMAGPDNTFTSVPALNMYLTSFRQNQFALGAAIGTILLILVAFVIVPYLSSSFRAEEGHA